MSESKHSQSLRANSAKAIYAVLERGESLRESLPRLQSTGSGDDNAWIQEMTFGVLRNVPLLQYWLRQLVKKPLTGKHKIIEHLLMLGFYQLSYSRVPAHAAVSETVQASVVLRCHALKGLVNATLRRFIRENIARQIPATPHIQHGLPKWLYKKLIEHYPAEFSHLAASQRQPAPLWLRINQRQISTENYIREYQQTKLSDGIPASTNNELPSAVVLQRSTKVTSLPGYHDGWFSVQDGAAQLAAHYLDPQVNERVLDACCAPGGKTSHILETQPQVAEVVAVDIDPNRLERTRDNLRRLQLQASVKCADILDPESWWDGVKFDRILLDAPCSGTGVIRRHPDILWLRKAADISLLTQLQSSILESLWHLLQPGGILLYATCSILKEENQQQIRQFLSRHGDAELIPITTTETEQTPGKQILPGEGQMDGFYYARLKKCSCTSA